jgi:hypothetical protein
MKKEDIQTKIDVIFNNLDELNFLKAKSYEEFISDFRNIDASLHILQTSIQALLDIGSYIIASLGLKTPNTNAEIIEILNEAGYILVASSAESVGVFSTDEQHKLSNDACFPGFAYQESLDISHLHIKKSRLMTLQAVSKRSLA